VAKKPPKEPEWYSITATAHLMGVSRATVYRLIWAEELPTVDIGLGEKRGKKVIPRRGIDEFMSKRAERVAS
jgi:excisionase family DNA binding protein